jgi:hypothetical protein
MSSANRFVPVRNLRAALSVTLLVLALALAVASPALANFEQVATFGETGTSSPFFEIKGIAVNSTGAGGVPAGTLYAVGNKREGPKLEGVNMYSAKAEFIGHWGEGFEANAVAVDQTTGDVYLRSTSTIEGADQILVYSADGSQAIASFGVTGNEFKPISESPEKIHTESGNFGVAVDSSGNVYVSDYLQLKSPEESRVMVFKPESPGDYKHYVYAGRSSDIGYTLLEEHKPYFIPENLAVDASGDLYMAAGTGDSVVEFNPSAPAAPVCNYKVPRGGANGIAVNPETKQVYYYTSKDKKHIYQLECNNAGEFTQTDSFVISPEVGTTTLRSRMPALAFDPVLEYEGIHPAGAIYAVSELGVGYILAPAASRPPVVESTAAVSVTASGALLGGVVNPKGFATGYVFQYIDDAAYRANEPGEPFAGAGEAPLGGGTLGGGTSGVSVEAALRGLSADTMYHYRLVATSHCNPSEEAEVCEVPGTAHTFRTFPSEVGVLPDGRAYELVSPALKSGGEVFPIFPSSESESCSDCKPTALGYHLLVQASTTGDTAAYMGFPFSFTEGAQQADEYFTRRTATGWQTTTLTPELQSRGRGYVGFDAGLNQGVLEQGGDATLSASAPAGYPNLYSQLTGEAAGFSPLVAAQPPNRGAGQFKMQFAGGSADYSKLFFEADDALTGETEFAPAAVDGGQQAYNLYESDGGSLRLVNVLPGNEATAPGATIGKGAYKDENATLFDYSHAISDDGSRVFWSDAAGQVYLRENGQSTREIPDHTGRFLTAAADGSKVLLEDGRLYDLESEQTVDLTEGQGGFLGIAGQSEDLSHVYFVDTGALTPPGQVNGNEEHAEAGKDNLYAWFEGTSTFLGRLLEKDGQFNFIYGAWSAAPAQRTAEASPDGHWFAFLSKAPLTGYDSTGPCFYQANTKKFVEGACTEAYLYDSVAGKLVCASCDRSGLAPLGPSHLPLLEDAPAGFDQVRYLTDQGRLYFDSVDSLSPFDSNHGVEDAYQYEPGGVGSCERAEGCVNLISSGRGAQDSNFLSTDATGKNVFFTTRDKLVAVDHDGLMDLYDAREGGGIASQSEVGQNTECHGEACQPPASGSGDPALASLSFEGLGDVFVSPTPVTPKFKPLSRAQKLARALRECRHEPKRKRLACRRAARKRFGGKAARARRAAKTRGARSRGGR